MPPGVIVQRVEQPSEAQVEASATLFASLTKDYTGVLALVGNDAHLLGSLARSMIRAGALAGEYYTATDENDNLIGFTVWMPPGQEMFSTEEQRKMGLYEYMAQLSDAGKEYFHTTYMAEFPTFVANCLGSTGKFDSWWLHVAMVRPENQGQGVGKALMAVVREKATQTGSTIALSTVIEKNVLIYTKMGLELKGHRTMPSPWGEWPLYVFSLETKTQ